MYLPTGFTVWRLLLVSVTIRDRARPSWKLVQDTVMATRLLIVDHHEVVRLGVRTLFGNNDLFEVYDEAKNGVDAIRMVSELSPDAVILDLDLPGMNGFEIAARIRLIAPSTRIVFFSGHEIPATARSVGADAFVSKSCPLQELALTVNRVLHLRTWEEHLATLTSRDTPLSEIGVDFNLAQTCWSDSILPIESAERRREPRAHLPQVLRIRPFDSSLLPEDCTTSNISHDGLYFATSRGHYVQGVYVYVTSDFQSENPMDHAVAGVVVRVEKLGDRKWGVAIRTFSPISSRRSIEPMTM
jgi:CheY-like chemotaxis protein